MVKACDPAHVIQGYTYRLSGRYQKKPDLKDLPSGVAEALIGCCLDGLKLHAPELDAAPEELIENPTRFWLDLGNNDAAERSGSARICACLGNHFCEGPSREQCRYTERWAIL
ncbi:hypothetical protein COOONC_02886 [Cooperia oncophora]